MFRLIFQATIRPSFKKVCDYLQLQLKYSLHTKYKGNESRALTFRRALNFAQVNIVFACFIGYPQPIPIIS